MSTRFSVRHYYAWGEIESKSDYNCRTYKYCAGDNYSMTKYCNDSSCGYNGYTDNKTVLDLEDDAAHANWGDSWRMPTNTEFQELIDNCTWTWTTLNGTNGYEVVSKVNGNSIFLPAAGSRYDTSLGDAGSYGYYWSSSLDESDSSYARFLFFYSGNHLASNYYRRLGQSVRPVLR